MSNINFILFIIIQLNYYKIKYKIVNNNNDKLLNNYLTV